MDNIVVVKTIDGEFMMGRLIAESEESITLDFALCLGYKIKEDYIPIVYFYKYCLYNNSYEVTLERKHIMNMFEDVMHYIERQYNIAVEKYKMHDVEFTSIDDDDDDVGEPLGNNIYNFFKHKNRDDDDGSVH